MTFKVSLLVSLAAAAVASPNGVAGGKSRFSIIDSMGAVVQTEDVDGLSADFTGIADGTFTGQAQLLDVNGANLFDPVTCSFVDAVEVPPAVMVTPFASISATITQE